MKNVLMLTLLLCGAMHAMPAAAQSCTEIGCVNGLSFTTAANYDWKNGQYDIRVALDYKTVECRGELPLHPCDQGPTFTCDDPKVRIEESGCAMQDDQHAITGIYIDDTPNKAMISIMRNVRPVITRTVVPQYAISRPNGPGCGPVCRSAAYELLAAEKRK